MREDKTCPTAATNMREIIYNPNFIAKLAPEVILFVLAHEVMHIVFKHGLRMRARNPQVWNIACDHAINLLLQDAGFTLWDKCCVDPQFKGMSAEQIYDQLMRDGGADAGQLPGGELMGDVLEPENLDSEARARIEREIQQKVAAAASMARMAGQLKGGLERLVNEILNPQVPWQDLLREYMTRVTHDDESWSRRNRRFATTVLPSRWSERMGEIVVIGDTSGSISIQDLAKVAAEVSSIADMVRPERIRILWADAEVAGEQVFEVGEPIVIEPKGGGGTDMRVPLTHSEQFEPEVVVMVTDCYTPWPEAEPPFPLIVCSTTDQTCPWGQTIRI